MPQPSSADRALRALADAAGEARPRTPADGADPDVPVAATVVILRDGIAGLEVLLMERPDRGSFAGAWVFPGGKVEAADAASVDEPEEDLARRAAVRETWEEIGLELDPALLVTLSCWDAPPGLPLRIRTWFFLATDPGGKLTLAPDEVVAAQWLRPAELLEKHGRGGLTLYPPTWVTLHGLADQPDAVAVLNLARIAGAQRFETAARRGAGGPVLLWEGDAQYDPDAAPAASGARHRLEVGALPWLYTRTE